MAKKNDWRRWLTPVNLPEAQIGKLRIKRTWQEPGWSTPLASMRTAFLQGDAPTRITFPVRTVWHELVEEDRGVWTSDLPIEAYQQRRDTRHFRGDVLLSGLGVGLIPTLLQRKANIRSVTVVERSSEVVCLVAPHLDPAIRIVNEDIFSYLEHTPDRYDYVFHDIWQSDSLMTFRHTVLPLKRLSRDVLRKPDEDYRRISNWNEGTMLGQIAMQCMNQIRAIEEPELARFYGIPDEHLDAPDLCLTAPFLRWLRAVKPAPSTARIALTESYLPSFGSTYWTRRWRHYGADKLEQHSRRFKEIE